MLRNDRRNGWTLRVAIAGLLVLGSSAGAAAEPPLTPEPGEAPLTYAFEDDAVLATTATPMGEVLNVRPGGVRESLVHARESFVVELLHSVEAL